jgi:hypothetical protein
MRSVAAYFDIRMAEHPNPKIRLFLKIELKPLDITLLKRHTDFGRQAK